jgi:molecular chaperone GrpE
VIGNLGGWQVEILPVSLSHVNEEDKLKKETQVPVYVHKVDVEGPREDLPPSEITGSEQDVDKWRDRALRLQAEMENFRKRRRRLAEEHIAEERERLLRPFLRVADDLERGWNAPDIDVQELKRGVEMTHQGLMRALEKQGITVIEAEGKAFDTQWHEAVGVVPHENVDLPSDTVVKVVQKGYQIDDRVLRPARVIVVA